MKMGSEKLISDKNILKKLKGKRIGLVGHPASTDKSLIHTLDLLKVAKLNLTCAFGPQHGLRGEKQDNMIESRDFEDPKLRIPIFSLYGEVRRPSQEMLDKFDVLLVDLQDLGCRIYTFLTTLFYLMEDCAAHNKSIWVLDRPNPAGRPIEGTYLSPQYFSFVGAAEIVMRHGLTLGEAGAWYKEKNKLDLDYHVVKMQGYDIEAYPGYGWPLNEYYWVNPSPNIPTLSGARMYAGTVLIEGTKLSEGRGTTRPLEVIGAPGIDMDKVLRATQKMIPKHLDHLALRPCFFEPTFQKHSGQLCSGVQIHIDNRKYSHKTFRPYRIVAAILKSIRSVHPDYDLWLSPPYEYEKINLPIDILSGGDLLRKWVDDPGAKWSDFESQLLIDEKRWLGESRGFRLY